QQPPVKPAQPAPTSSKAKPPANQPEPSAGSASQTASAQPAGTGEPEPASATDSTEPSTSTSQPDTQPVVNADSNNPTGPTPRRPAGGRGPAAPTALHRHTPPWARPNPPPPPLPTR